VFNFQIFIDPECAISAHSDITVNHTGNFTYNEFGIDLRELFGI